MSLASKATLIAVKSKKKTKNWDDNTYSVCAPN